MAAICACNPAAAWIAGDCGWADEAEPSAARKEEAGFACSVNVGGAEAAWFNVVCPPADAAAGMAALSTGIAVAACTEMAARQFEQARSSLRSKLPQF